MKDVPVGSRTSTGEDFEYESETLALMGQMVLPPESYIRLVCGKPPRVELAVDVFTNVTRRHRFKFRAPGAEVDEGGLRGWLDGVRRKVVDKLLQEYYRGELPKGVKVPAVLRRLNEEVRRLAEREGVVPNVYTIPKFSGFDEAVAHILVAHFLLDLAERCLTACSPRHRDGGLIPQLNAEVRIDLMWEVSEEQDGAEVVEAEDDVRRLVFEGYRRYKEFKEILARKRDVIDVDLYKDHSLLEYRARKTIAGGQLQV